mmetsp:Transcript_25977/g.60986  ORF Transcript_25977/g.60986 Transcript_25977/m.60986 type:complete len:414 (-) Transcript_25977:92-1333(-)|eukprot:CAMPEP_0197175584 /NCGR_PEP_ID=MMETSP1423-20130617/1766_1 /TAXON_ID=476441 /ORGANISM="Pseudo-nitzschia heimii, Strain UNC1101" /LENGTH=413 /DNA_ID=CAMNT_0042624773 /DNA_START=81 /DNA_END=1322 /DNA_ORIENTATION=-
MSLLRSTTMPLLWYCIWAQILLSSLRHPELQSCHCFSMGATSSASLGVTEAKYDSNSSSSSSSNSNNNNILILDHINMNHGKGRHDWLKSFYGEDFLGCAWDPRKAKNLETGRKTLWANLGAHQFHLPEGSPDAQVLDGVITVVHPSPETLLERYNSIRNGESSPRSSCLNDSLFHAEMAPEGDEPALIVMDPWGSVFRIVPGTNHRDPRGSQPGDPSEGLAISDLLIHVPANANLDGIGRFYESILGGEVVAGADHRDARKSSVQIRMGPFQTLTFLQKESIGVDSHVDLREVSEDVSNDTEQLDCAAGTSIILGNYGVHISLYVADLPTAYGKARDLGLAYVNRRFSRRAYTLEEAVRDCMFRCLDIVDPLHPEDGPILRLEHEVRSVVKQDGSKYKSCPFDEIPEGCVTL